MRLPIHFKACLAFTAFCLFINSSANAADRVRVAVAQQSLWDTGVAMVAAQREGFFAKENLDVQVRFMRNAPEIIQTMILGENDAAIGVGVLAVIGAFAKGAPIRIISAEMTGSEYYWYVKASSPIKSVKDLAGRTVGHNALGSAAHLATLALKEYSGVDMKLVVAGRMADNLTEVLSGQIDAGYGLPPVGLEQIENGELRIIARGSEVPALRHLTSRVNLASTDFLKNKRDILVRLMRARTNAIKWMFDNPDESSKLFAEIAKVPKSIAHQVFNSYTIDNLEPAPIEKFQESLQEAQKYGFISEPLTDAQLKELVDLVYVPQPKN